jgi:hypothetical protein
VISHTMEQPNRIKPTDVVSYEQLEHEFSKIYIIKDEGVLKVLLATVIANQILRLKPVWLMLVTSSSGGKTALLDTLNDLASIIVPISDLTVNTFASGMKRTGKETSLLHTLRPGSILTFKDFTSIISIAKEARTSIMKQLREIYDGSYVKRTGNGHDVHWSGKVGAVAGVTEIVYEHMEDLSAMGDRFIMYSIDQPDRMDVARRSMKNENKNMYEEEAHLRACVNNYIKHVLTIKEKEIDLELDGEIMDDLLNIANFVTIIRSGVIMDDYRGIVKFVPTPEMPMRVTKQLYSLAIAFIMMRLTNPFIEKIDGMENKITLQEAKILYKTAFSSIPVKRRKAIVALAQYKGGVSTAGLAVKLNYEQIIVRQWLSQLNGLGVVSRQRRNGPQGDTWNLNKEYRDLLVQFENIKVIDDRLEASMEELGGLGADGDYNPNTDPNVADTFMLMEKKRKEDELRETDSSLVKMTKKEQFEKMLEDF